MRIVLMLMQFGQLNVSELSRRLKVNYGVAKKHLGVLENEGVLRHIQYGRVRLYRLNEDSQKTMALQDLVKTWNIEEK